MEKPTRSAHLFRFGPYEIDLTAGELHKSGRRISLQEQPFQVLALLLIHSGKLVTREELQRRVWPADTFVDFDLGLNTTIKKIRAALGDSAENPKFVETLPKRGYRFICPVEEITSNASGGNTKEIAIDDRPEASPETKPGPPVPEDTRTSQSGRRGLWPALGILALLSLLVVFSFNRLRNGTSPKVASESIKSIAVLPFMNESKDPDENFFADGMTEELITSLAQLPGLSVTSHTSVLQYRGKATSIPQIREELKVDAIVEGTVTRSGNKIRITAQLIQTATDKHLWAGRYEGNSQDILALQSDVAKAIAGNILSTVTREELEKLGDHGTRVPAAYDSYLRGLGFLLAYDMPEKNDRAIAAFEEAVKDDPSYALAYAGLSEACWRKYKAVAEEALKARAEEACHQALTLDAMHPSGHVCQGILDSGTGQYERAVEDFSAAIRSGPPNASSARAYQGRAGAYQRLGKIAEAEKDYLQAIELDARNWRGYAALGQLYYHQSRYGESARRYEQAVELKFDNSESRIALGADYIELGEYGKAISVLQVAVKLRPSAEAYDNLGTAFLNERRFPEAVESFQKTVALKPSDYHGYGSLARAYYWTPGRQALAQENYQQAIAMAKKQLMVNEEDPEVNLNLAIYNAMLVRKDEALYYLGRTQQLQPSEPESAFWAAVIHLQLGDRAGALMWVGRARALKYSPAEINDAPEFDSLRADPEFQRVRSADGRPVAFRSNPESKRSAK